MSGMHIFWALYGNYFWVQHIGVINFWRSRKGRLAIISWLFLFSWSSWVSSNLRHDLLKMVYPQNGFCLVDNQLNENGFVSFCRAFSSAQYDFACVHRAFPRHWNVSRATHDSSLVPITSNLTADSLRWIGMASPVCTSETSKFRGLSSERPH